jgi:hypothetical protein
MARVCLHYHPDAPPGRKLQGFARGQRQMYFNRRATAIDSGGDHDVSLLDPQDASG